MHAASGAGDPDSAQARVASALRAEIAAGRLRPGSALSEVALADEYGVSRTPVREALKQLQIEGLVVIRPRVGTFVTALTRLEIVELFQVKEILEGAAARLFAGRGDVALLDALHANVDRADEAVARQDVDGYASLVDEFHELIVQGAGNSRLAQHYRTMMNQLAYSRLVHTSLRRPGRLSESETEHRRVAEIISAKDGMTAERFMREHVRASGEAVLESMNLLADEADTGALGALVDPAGETPRIRT